MDLTGSRWLNTAAIRWFRGDSVVWVRSANKNRPIPIAFLVLAGLIAGAAVAQNSGNGKKKASKRLRKRKSFRGRR
jgi:hypothetical protein